MRSKKNKIFIKRETSWVEGDLVWAKFQHRKWYPAIIVKPENVNRPFIEGKQVVLWFYEALVSQIAKEEICDFKTNYDAIVKSCNTHSGLWWEAVKEALQELRNQMQDVVPKKAIRWASRGFMDYQERTRRIPPSLVKSFKKIAKGMTAKEKSREKSKEKESKLREKIKAAHTNKEFTFCLGCYNDQTDNKHPFFEGNICNGCTERLIRNLDVIGEDGIAYNCIVCGHRDNIFICDNTSCAKVYCQNCLKYMAASTAMDTINQLKEWKCFLCEDMPSSINGLLIPRKDSVDRKVSELAVNYPHQVVKQPFQWDPNVKLRVLSLNDGIATCLHVLKEHGIDVGVYYASEIDEDSKDIAIVNHGDQIKYIGDVRLITEDMLKKIMPIHLLIGGFPCNDLSTANPDRKGLFDISGSGPFFFEYFRILTIINKYTDGLFWFYENVCSMSSEASETISRYFQCEPVRIDAYDLCPHHRARYYWGNCPNLKLNMVAKKPTLQSYLMPGRTALVKSLRTLTTKTNSLLRGPNREHPVEDRHGQKDIIWVTEAEKLFGFPVNYTNTGNLSKKARFKALGMSYNVGTIKHILGFLPKFLEFGLLPTTSENDHVSVPSTSTTHKSLEYEALYVNRNATLEGANSSSSSISGENWSRSENPNTSSDIVILLSSDDEE